MKKILITGGAGFIGSQLVDYLLKKKYEVLVFDNLSVGKQKSVDKYFSNPHFSFIKLDLLDKKKLLSSLPETIDTVFHLAANSDLAKSATDTGIDIENTIIATHNLLEAMRIKRIKKIFFTSSSAIYGNVGLTFFAENYGPLFPESTYSSAKISAEAFIAGYVNMFDMQAWIVRPANIIGPHATHGVIYDLINKLRKNPKQLEILGDGKQSKAYLYITDVLDAFYLIWKKGNKPINLYNITSADFITVTEIAHTIIKGIGLKNVKLLYTGGRAGWKGDVPTTRINGDAIKKLGWKNSYTTKEAVGKTVQDLLNEL